VAAWASAVPASMYGGQALSACIGLDSEVRASCVGEQKEVTGTILQFVTYMTLLLCMLYG
jgi:hypothetical protein